MTAYELYNIVFAAFRLVITLLSYADSFCRRNTDFTRGIFASDKVICIASKRADNIRPYPEIADIIQCYGQPQRAVPTMPTQDLRYFDGRPMVAPTVL